MLLKNLEDHASIVYEYARERIDVESFQNINNVADESSQRYIRIQKELNNIRQIANIRYLYTAKQNNQGEFIYVIDGLEKDAADFRHVGMPIEDGIRPDLQRCLQGEIVIGETFQNTKWGIVFITYWPVYGKDGQVADAIGMEFDVENLYVSYCKIRFYCVLISGLIIIIFSIIALLALKKVFEPFYKKLAYIDIPTGMRNRTAFELELEMAENKIKKGAYVCIITFDLNNLKLVNDRFGHTTGDRYIKAASQVILKHFSQLGTCYRVGGDEFAVIVIDQSYEEIETLLKKEFLKSPVSILDDSHTTWQPYFNISFGQAEYTEDVDSSLHDTFNRADECMYSCKKKMKANVQ